MQPHKGLSKMALKQLLEINYNKLLIALAVFMALIFTAGFFYFSRQKKDTLVLIENDLASIGALKSAEIANWRYERLSDGEMIYAGTSAKQNILEYCENPEDKRLEKQISRWLNSKTIHRDYECAHIVTMSNKFLLSSRKEHSIPESHLDDCFKALGGTKKVLLTDFHDAKHGDSHLTLVVPISDEEGVKALIIFELNPDAFLLPLIKNWPVKTETAETLLVEEKNGFVFFLADLRHAGAASVNNKFPVTESRLPAAKAIAGHEGFFRGVDYRGIKVLSVTRSIKGSPWFLVTKIDESEAFRPLKRRTTNFVILTLFIFLSSYLLILNLWNKQNIQWLKKQSEAETKLRVLSSHYDYLTKYANDIILLMDKDGKIIEANEKAIGSYGYSREELLKMNVAEIRAMEERNGIPEHIDNIVQSGGLLYETVHRRKNGTTFPIEVSARIINIEGVIYFQAIIRDISERKAAQSRLSEKEERYRELFENIRSCVAVYRAVNNGEDFIFVDFNASAEALEKVDRREILGRRVTEVFPGVREFGLFDILKSVYSTGEPRHHPTALYKDNRLTSWRENFVYKLPSGEIVAIYDDLTEKKEYENSIIKLNQELEGKVKERTRELEASNKELEAFSYSVSHDLRAPLRAIDAFTKIFKEEYSGKLDAEAKRICNIIVKNISWMSRLIDDLLSFSRVGKQHLSLTPVNMEENIKIIWNDLKIVFPDRAITLKVHKMPGALCDLTMIRQVFTNLLSNAIKFTQNNSNAVIEAGGEAGESENTYFVKDNGVGFDMQYYSKLFSVFERLHSSQDFEGSGIGLAIVKRVIERHGGRVWAESKPGEGAVFYFSLPNGEETL
ncbi:MAG TPA: hypothetical protein DEE98_03020 [Elusimicrobia bacterium]|nr:hypothetical protein [Elusimicrobiota bacterium]